MMNGFKALLEGLGGVLFLFISFFLFKEYLPEQDKTATKVTLIFVIVGSFWIGQWLLGAFLNAM